MTFTFQVYSFKYIILKRRFFSLKMDKKVENLMSYKNPMALHGKKIKKSKKETKQPPPSALTAHAKFKSIRKANGNHPPISREPPPGMTPKISTERKTILENKVTNKI